ncbi:MAG: hypothetical protein CMO32_00370 [Variovorax sp.]|nr:hypothetical protein [Variovorax sp.]
MIRKSAHQDPLHFTRASLIALGLQLAGLGKQLPGIHGLQTGAELLLGLSCLLTLALLFSVGREPYRLAGRARRSFALRRSIDCCRHTCCVILRADGQDLAFEATFFDQGVICPNFTTLNARSVWIPEADEIRPICPSKGSVRIAAGACSFEPTAVLPELDSSSLPAP